MNNKKAFTIIEMIISIGILTGLMAAVTPLVVTQINIAHAKHDAREVLLVEQAARNFYKDNYSWPASVQELKDGGYLNPGWHGNDSWGEPIEVENTEHMFKVTLKGIPQKYHGGAMMILPHCNQNASYVASNGESYTPEYYSSLEYEDEHYAGTGGESHTVEWHDNVFRPEDEMSGWTQEEKSLSSVLHYAPEPFYTYSLDTVRTDAFVSPGWTGSHWDYNNRVMSLYHYNKARGPYTRGDGSRYYRFQWPGSAPGSYVHASMDADDYEALQLFSAGYYAYDTNYQPVEEYDSYIPGDYYGAEYLGYYTPEYYSSVTYQDEGYVGSDGASYSVAYYDGMEYTADSITSTVPPPAEALAFQTCLHKSSVDPEYRTMHETLKVPKVQGPTGKPYYVNYETGLAYAEDVWVEAWGKYASEFKPKINRTRKVVQYEDVFDLPYGSTPLAHQPGQVWDHWDYTHTVETSYHNGDEKWAWDGGGWEGYGDFGTWRNITHGVPGGWTYSHAIPLGGVYPRVLQNSGNAASGDYQANDFGGNMTYTVGLQVWGFRIE